MSKKNSLISPLYHFIFAITSSVVGAIIASWPLLVIFILIQKTNQTVKMSLMQIMHNYNQLLWYLVWPFQQQLKMTNFPTSKMAAAHFADVKKLFILVIFAFICCLLIYFLTKKKKSLRLNKTWALLFLLLPIVVVPFAMTNFDSFFVIFHHMLFNNNNWLFDPSTDPIINVLTEGFFASCFAVAGIIYELYFADKLLQR
ncbi:TIGR01906 family membrane protein [Lactobacillus sp. ESL0791]|uniref:TIGR01906 family membrane protein n=1 Tax=Lactobacillus sp. ESL0791 TaxID=2983234 RepID=UPI0023F7236A|nr:TIGR01906 family membrane protein [Lactobacillus sp. ESL0791]MDF7638482.1 TIGR01906 family membrane protein [Lactobacillus sp. ESL0791]